jgi:hypothetical protein
MSSLVFESSVTIRVYRKVLFQKCIHNCSSGSTYVIILGSTQWNLPKAGSLVLSSSTSIVHGQFDRNYFDNDIALIQLPTIVKFTREYYYILTNVKIILLVLEKIKCFLIATQNCIRLSHSCG